MSSGTTLPSLFGRLSRVLNEHDRLGKTTQQLSELCTAIESGKSELPAELQPETLLSNLGRELTRHFAAEEDESHFGAVARERPALLTDIVALKDDHRTILRIVESLALIAAEESRWVELPVPLRGLLDVLRQHEQAESRMLKEFFTPEATQAL
jgi:hypothetical protein